LTTEGCCLQSIHDELQPFDVREISSQSQHALP